MKFCNQCVHRGRSGGINRIFRHACFNKKSRHYMKLLWHEHPACEMFQFNTKGANNGK